MSSTNKTANYQLSQFVGTDIPSILNDYNGDMRKIDTAIKDIANAEGSSASDIAELQSTVGQHTTEISGINSSVNNLTGRVLGIEGKIPANASESNKLITAEDIPEIPSIEGLEDRVGNLENDVENIGTNVSTLSANVRDLDTSVSVVQSQMESLAEQYQYTALDVLHIQQVIPENASTSNKLATMADIGGGSSSGLKLALSVADGRTPTSSESTAITNFINTYRNHQNNYTFFARVATTATAPILSATVSIDSNKIDVSTTETLTIGASQIEQQFCHANIGASSGTVNCVSLVTKSSGNTLTDVGLGVHNVEIYVIELGD